MLRGSLGFYYFILVRVLFIHFLNTSHVSIFICISIWMLIPGDCFPQNHVHGHYPPHRPRFLTSQCGSWHKMSLTHIYHLCYQKAPQTTENHSVGEMVMKWMYISVMSSRCIRPGETQEPRCGVKTVLAVPCTRSHVCRVSPASRQRGLPTVLLWKVFSKTQSLPPSKEW